MIGGIQRLGKQRCNRSAALRGGRADLGDEPRVQDAVRSGRVADRGELLGSARGRTEVERRIERGVEARSGIEVLPAVGELRQKESLLSFGTAGRTDLRVGAPDFVLCGLFFALHGADSGVLLLFFFRLGEEVDDFGGAGRNSGLYGQRLAAGKREGFERHFYFVWRRKIAAGVSERTRLAGERNDLCHAP